MNIQPNDIEKALVKRPTKVLVCGGRDFSDKEFVFKILDKLNPDIVVAGGARGADTLAEDWCRERKKILRRYPAKWNLHGKMAGPLRNQEMITKEGEGLDLVIAFPGGRGTADMVQRSVQKLGEEKVILFRYA